MDDMETSSDSQGRNFVPPEFYFKEHGNMARRVGDIESKVAVIKAEFMGVKDQVFTMQSMMVKLGETSFDMKMTNELIRSEMKSLKEQVILMNSLKDADGIISVARRVAPLVAVAVQLATLCALLWGFLMFAGKMTP